MPNTTSDSDLREMWRAAGGGFHGSHVEMGYMEEAKLLPFLRKLIQDPFGYEAAAEDNLRRMSGD